MLSAEHVFASGQGPESRAAANALTNPAPPGSNAAEAGRKLKQLAEECQGDHLLLLRLYQMWAAAGFTRDFVKAYGLELRGMNFAKDIRKQLAGVQGMNCVKSERFVGSWAGDCSVRAIQ
jgi:ATP-dependent RNA helicase DHX8/PRP22